MTNKSDLEKARIIAGYTKDSAVICEIALALKAERERLPESVELEINTALKYLGNQECSSCELSVGHFCPECSIHKGLTAALWELKAWQQGEPETGKGE